ASASAVARSPWSLERSIACLPQFVHRPVEPGADVRGADARYAGDLAIGEAGEELERDQLPLARLEPIESGVEEQSQLVATLVDTDARRIDGIDAQLGLAPTAAQLVERRVAGDAEEPGAGASTARVEARASAEGALEGKRGHVLGGGAVA